MTSAHLPAPTENCGTDYISVLAQTWAVIEPRQHGIDEAYDGSRPVEELVNDFLEAEDPYPVGTEVFAARWKPGQWGIAQVINRVDVDEWVVVFLDGSGRACRDHVELCPAF